MTAGAFGRMPRVAAIVVALGLGTATLTLAATSTTPPATPQATPVATVPSELVVPDVRRQAYVFAKGTLEQAGFAWRVQGSVAGYAANVVVGQSPAPGAKVVPNGAPTIVLTLSRNGAYPQEGTPENESPYAGAPARLVGAKLPAKPKAATPKPARAVAAASKPKPAAKPAKQTAKAPAPRTPAFAVPGAPAEPLDEPPLTDRARALAAWVEAHPKPTSQNVSYWLYQHNWIVTGARFGWSNGAEALRTLLAVDARVRELWQIGQRSEALAERVLADVEARSR